MRMITGFRFLLVLAALPGLHADPANGIGLVVGAVSASQGGVTSTGQSLGVDAQFGLKGGAWSINPYLMVSMEKDKDGSEKRSDNLGGVQFRRWVGPVYFGPQLFFHDRLLLSGGNVTNSQYGPGAGVVLGYEARGGFTFGAQLDALEAQFLQSADRRNAVRVYLGYRWH